MTHVLLSHYMPTTHGTHVDFFLPWAHRVMARAPGLNIEIACEGSALGLLGAQFAQVSQGDVDIAHSPAHLPPGRFPLLNLMNLPFAADSAGDASLRLWAAFDRYLKAEFGDLHVLALHADSGGVLHMRSSNVQSVADLAGKTIRTPAGPITDTLRALGANPVNLLPPEIGPAAQRGELDGAIMAWDVLSYTQTADIFCHHFSDVFYVSPLYLVMNGASWNRLTTIEQQAFDAESGAALAPRFGDFWQAWSAQGRSEAETRGQSILPLPASLRAAFHDASKAPIEAHLARLETQGVSNAREVFAALTAPQPNPVP